MCLAIPGRIIEIYDEAGLSMGRLEYGGIENRACLAYVPEIKVGDYAIVHAGFAISILDEEAALESIAAWEEIARLEADEEQAGPQANPAP
ncbi:MAG: HypC/HybG/HupF family hydrogenase formation chaperone [Candidatus Neomarinimicrobiota bacterium]